MNELIFKVKEWSLEIGLDKANPNKQILKLAEEFGELCAGYLKDKEEVTKDSVGDMLVVITIFAQQTGLSHQDIFRFGYLDLSDDNSDMILHRILTKIGEIRYNYEELRKPFQESHLCEIVNLLDQFCGNESIELLECFNMAYQTIVNRRGKMLNDVFVKEEDLEA